MKKSAGIIIEWENALLADVERARALLKQLQSQALEMAEEQGYSFDLIVLFDPEEIDRKVPSTVLSECVNETIWPGTVQLKEAEGFSYYKQKNYGAELAKSEIIIFIDSDVIPDDGWLRNILEALGDPDVKVIGGETYLSTDTFVDRLYAAFWLFDIKKASRPVYKAKNFYANNVAFRGEIIRENPFPDTDTSRGQCAALAKSLRSQGITIHRAGSSMVAHPAPLGLFNFIRSAVCHGHDVVHSRRQKRFGWLKSSPLGSTIRFIRDVVKTPFLVFQRRSVLRSFPEFCAALVMGLTYAITKYMGELLSFFAPGVVRRHFFA